MEERDDFIRCSEVIFLDAELQPVEERHATFAKVVYENGEIQLLELE
jgi:hypothetical protein